jgi:hypothetical protein
VVFAKMENAQVILQIETIAMITIPAKAIFAIQQAIAPPNVLQIQHATTF